MKKGESFVDPGVTATNSNGINVSSSVISTGSVNTNVAGNYTITYTYDNVSVIRNVIVY